MKTGTLNLFSLLLFIGVFSVSGCSKASPAQNIINSEEEATLSYYNNQINNLPVESLSDAEKESLLFMREEEKMARDVYLTLGKKYNANAFTNIASAEQTHMNAVLTLLKKYSVTDPVGNNAVGVFKNAEIQTLYNQLVTSGNLSLLNALKAGATIEDKDVYDLLEDLKKVDNQDIIFVFNNLLKGSKNHMRAFYRNITRLGATYTPQYITQAELDLILSGQ